VSILRRGIHGRTKTCGIQPPLIRPSRPAGGYTSSVSELTISLSAGRAQSLISRAQPAADGAHGAVLGDDSSGPGALLRIRERRDRIREEEERARLPIGWTASAAIPPHERGRWKPCPEPGLVFAHAGRRCRHTCRPGPVRKFGVSSPSPKISCRTSDVMRQRPNHLPVPSRPRKHRKERAV
jgi:hypothetical protein